MEQPSRVVLTKALFWMRMYDLPTGAMENIIHELGSKAGGVITIGYPKKNYLGGRYARVRIELDVSKPLIRGTQLKVRGKNPMIIPFKYERLQHFCFRCGCLGHVKCDCEDGSAPHQLNQYGDALRASPNSSKYRTMSGDKTERPWSTLEIESHRCQVQSEQIQCGERKIASDECRISCTYADYGRV